MTRKLLAVFAPVLAVAAFVVAPAAAVAEPVTLTAGGTALPNGAEIQAFSSNLVFSTNVGINLECAENELSGEVTENPGAKVAVTGTRFEGEGGGPCATNNPALTADIQEVEVGPIVFSKNNPVTGQDEAPASFTSLLLEGETVVAVCRFVGTVNTEYELNSPLGDEVVPPSAFTQVLETCPATSGTLSGTLAVTSGGVAVEVE